MQTQGHMILNLGLLGRRQRPALNGPILLGALYPDLGLFGFYFWTRVIQGLPEREIWQTTYFLPGWQSIFGAFHSIPVALGLLGLAWVGRRWAIRRSLAKPIATSHTAEGIVIPIAEKVAAFSGAAVLHCLEDLPLHHDDGHQHFWPLSTFRFESPVSYWDRNHHAVWGAGAELVLVLGASAFVWHRTRSRWGRALLLLIGTVYCAAYTTYFF